MREIKNYKFKGVNAAEGKRAGCQEGKLFNIITSGCKCKGVLVNSTTAAIASGAKQSNYSMLNRLNRNKSRVRTFFARTKKVRIVTSYSPKQTTE